MTPLNRRNIGRHELIGLQVVVESERCAAYSTIKGRVVDETKNTIVVFDGAKQTRIPKGAVDFSFILPDNSTLFLKGKKIIGRPEDRMKMRRRNER